ncbi:MAG: type II and III secretion system protein family protein [Pseudomonadota bacterium]
MSVALRLPCHWSLVWSSLGVLIAGLFYAPTPYASDGDIDPLLSQLGVVAEEVLRDRSFSRLPPGIDDDALTPTPNTVVADSTRVEPHRTSLSLQSDLHAGEVLVPVNMSQVIQLDGNFGEVSIGNPDIADVVPLTTSSIYVFGKQFGTTSLTVTGEQGQVMAVVDLVVSFNIDELKERLHDLVPGQSFEVRPAHDGLVLSGQVASAAALDRALAIANRYAPDRVTNLVEVTGSQQVMLAVRFAEVERSVVKQLGFTNAFAIDGSDFDAALITGDGPSSNPPSFAIADLAATIGDLSLDLLLDTLEDKGVIKTLAEPNLIALSGDSAEFLAGGEFPIPVGRDVDDDGGIEVTIEFKEFGVSLSFTPTVLASDFINLELFTEVSEIDPNSSILADNLVIPGLKVRRAETTVELGDGQSFAIAGLLQEDFEDAVRQFPLLGDVPVLGTLFRSTAWRTGQTELVVIVTPHLVRPVRPGSLLTPDELFDPPTQAELFLMGKTEGEGKGEGNGQETPPGLVSAAGIVGPYGYILK